MEIGVQVHEQDGCVLYMAPEWSLTHELLSMVLAVDMNIIFLALSTYNYSCRVITFVITLMHACD